MNIRRVPGFRARVANSSGCTFRTSRIRSQRVIDETLAWFDAHGPATVAEYARDRLLSLSGAGQRVRACIEAEGLAECADRPGYWERISVGPKVG